MDISVSFKALLCLSNTSKSWLCGCGFFNNYKKLLNNNWLSPHTKRHTIDTEHCAQSSDLWAVLFDVEWNTFSFIHAQLRWRRDLCVLHKGSLCHYQQSVCVMDIEVKIVSQFQMYLPLNLPLVSKSIFFVVTATVPCGDQNSISELSSVKGGPTSMSPIVLCGCFFFFF